MIILLWFYQGRFPVGFQVFIIHIETVQCIQSLCYVYWNFYDSVTLYKKKNAAWRKFTALNTNVSLPAVSSRVDPAMGLFSKCLLCYRKKRSVAPTAKRGDGKAESHSATALGFR